MMRSKFPLTQKKKGNWPVEAQKIKSGDEGTPERHEKGLLRLVMDFQPLILVIIGQQNILSFS